MSNHRDTVKAAYITFPCRIEKLEEKSDTDQPFKDLGLEFDLGHLPVRIKFVRGAVAQECDWLAPGMQLVSIEDEPVGHKPYSEVMNTIGAKRDKRAAKNKTKPLRLDFETAVDVDVERTATGNQLVKLPPELGNLTALKKL